MASIGAVGGLGSNLDVAGLVEKLMTVERQPLTKLEAKEAAVQVKISAYGSFRSSLASFQGSLQTLASNSNYTVNTATVEDATLASASASDKASAGTYSLEVQKLATAQKLASGVFTKTSDPVGTGTITFNFGSFDGTDFTANGNKPSQSVVIDDAHNSLQGVRDAINAANIGVSANIVNDGKGFRLVVSSKDTGASNTLKIDVADNDGTATPLTGLSQFAYDPAYVPPTPPSDPMQPAVEPTQAMSQIMAGQDSVAVIDGLTVTRSSNTVADAIEGVTISLTKANMGVTTKLNIASDTTGVATRVDTFVKAYNDLNKTIKDLTKSSQEETQRGALSGDAAIRSAASDIRDGLAKTLAGGFGSFKALPQVGITFDRDGNLVLDKAKFADAMKADPSSVQGLFATAGKVDDSLVSYVSDSKDTKAGSFGINVTQVATQGTLTASSGISSLSVTPSNNTLSFKIDGISATVSLTAKNYASYAELATEIQSRLNGTTAGKGVSVTADNNGGLSLQAATWGSGSKLEVTGGTAAMGFFGAEAVAGVDGLDVQGTIGGVLATGAGQRLTGTGAAAGLKVDVLGGLTGDRGVVQHGVGIAGQLGQLVDKIVGSKGLISSMTTSLQSQVKQIQNDHEALEARLETVEKRYTTQFNALDEQMTRMQQLSSYLTQQLAAIKTG